MFTEVANLMEGEWSCYRSGHFIEGRMVMLRRWSVLWRENGYFTEVLTLMEGEWSCYEGGQFKGGRMVMLQCSLMEGEKSCQRVRGGQFNGGRIVILWRWPVQRRENGCYRGGLFNGGEWSF